MGFKQWSEARKEKRESQQRADQLTEEEIEELRTTEKNSYLEVARKQVTYRGKINAYKDFPINETDRQEIDLEEDKIKSKVKSKVKVKKEENEEDEKDLDEEIEEEINKTEKARMSNILTRELNKGKTNRVYQTIRPV